MELQKRRHRHLVALPVFIALLAVSFASATEQFSDVLSSVATKLHAETDEQFTQDNGVYGIVYTGGEVAKGDMEIIRHGSAVLASDGLIRAQLGGFTVTSFDGIIHLTHGTTTVSIAAITAPVFVSYGDRRIVVPVGMQWEGAEVPASLADGYKSWMNDRVVRPLPPHFVQRVLRDMADVQKADSALPDRQAFLPVNLPDADVLLPVSKQRKLLREYEDILGYVRTVVEGNDIERMKEIATMPVVSAALASDRGQNVVATLLSSVSSEDTGMRMLLLQQFMQQEDAWMVSVFHPKYRDIAWASFEPDVSVESQLTRVFLFPYSFFSPEEVSEFVSDRYSTALLSILDTVQHKQSFIEFLLDAHLLLVTKLDEMGYPLRAQFLEDTLMRIIDAADTQSDVLKAARTTLLNRDHISVQPLPPKQDIVTTSTHESDAVPEEVLTPDQVEATAHRMLTDAGAMFTVDTDVSANEPNTARVTDIVFGSSTADRTVSFSLNVATKTVSNIEIDGNSNFPYEPTFEGFVTWIRK